LLYWYKTANTDAAAGSSEATLSPRQGLGWIPAADIKEAITNLRRENLLAALPEALPPGNNPRGRGGSSVERYSIFWLYWYKSTNTYASGKRRIERGEVLNFLALLVQKYKHLRLGEEEDRAWRGTQFFGFTGTNVQILTPRGRGGLSVERYSIF
jgi:hypothetical protein